MPDLDQINITVTDIIPPDNFATVDAGVKIGTVYTKAQDNEWRKEVEATTQSGIKGVLKPNTPYDAVNYPYPKPWVQGDSDLYEKYDVNEAGNFPSTKDVNGDPLEVLPQDLDGNEIQIWIKNGVAEVVKKALPQASVNIRKWEDLQVSDFPLLESSQVIFNDSQWIVLNGKTANSGDTPSNDSNIWKQIGVSNQFSEDVLNLDFSNQKKTQFAPDDRSSVVGDVDHGTTAYYFEYGDYKNTKTIHLTAYSSGTVSIGFIKITGLTGTVLYSENVNVVAGNNTFDIGTLTVPSNVLTEDYKIGIKPATIGVTKYDDTVGGSLNVLTNTGDIIETDFLQPFWVETEIDYAISKVPKTINQLDNLLNKSSASESLTIPENRNGINMVITGGVGVSYGEEEIWFNKANPLEKLSIYSRSDNDVYIDFVDVFQRKLIQSVVKTCVVGLNEFTFQQLGFTGALGGDKIHIFCGNKDSADPNIIHGQDDFIQEHEWYTYSHSTPKVSFYYSNQRFSFWIDRLTELSFIDKIKRKWFNKKGKSFGDSITAQDEQFYPVANKDANFKVKGYQTYVREHFDCTVDNHGMGGFTMPEILAVIKAQNFANVDFTTLTSGANDARVGIPVGSVAAIGATFNDATYAGAIQSAIEFILSQNPYIKIYLIAPIKGWFNESGTPEVPNTNIPGMEIPRTYVDVIIEIGQLYGIPVCNWYDNSGINKITRPIYIGDPDNNPYYLHPNNEGYELMGKMLCQFMENY